MPIDLMQNKNLILGADSLLAVPEGIIPQRFTPENAWLPPTGFMQDCSAGIRLAFTTDADHLCLKMILGPCNFEFGRGDVDILLNGKLLCTFQPEGPWEDGQNFQVEADLPGTLSEITVYLPTYRKTTIQSLELHNAQTVRALPPRKKILFIGDSIVQGYGPTPAFCWAAQYARRTDRDFLNLGVGGAMMPQALPEALLQRDFDEVLLAFGCNDAHLVRPAREVADGLMKMLASLRSRPCRITVSSPVTDLTNDGLPDREQAWTDISAAIRKIAGSDSRIHYLDGADLIPHESSYFVDGIHPALKGATILADAYCRLYQDA